MRKTKINTNKSTFIYKIRFKIGNYNNNMSVFICL